jgi:hypothetical protein
MVINGYLICIVACTILATAIVVAAVMFVTMIGIIAAMKAQPNVVAPSSSLEQAPVEDKPDALPVKREFIMSYIATSALSSMPASELVGAAPEYGTLLFTTTDCTYNLQLLLSIVANRHQTNRFVILAITELESGALDGSPANEVINISRQDQPQTM